MRSAALIAIAGLGLTVPGCNARSEDKAAREAVRDAGQAVENAAESARPVLDAAKTTAEIKAALFTDRTVSAFNVDVDTSSERRTVHLRGTVDTEVARAKAEAIAREKAPGYAVHNELRVDTAVRPSAR
jgi:osmotically-inducible protein OsmY